MATAKSYSTFPIEEGPYTKNSKQYVKVRTNKGIIKEVRWYEENKVPSYTKEKEESTFNARTGFGFGETGHILLLNGKNEDIQKWRLELPSCTIWYNTIFGWYIPADKEPDEVPAEINCIPLCWDQIKDKTDPSGTKMIDKEEVCKIVNKLFGIENGSIFQGKIGETILRNVFIKSNISVDSTYGKSHLHIMEDSDKNIYVWLTSTKSLEEGVNYNLSMRVKEHRIYNGVNQTVVYYCTIK